MISIKTRASSLRVLHCDPELSASLVDALWSAPQHLMQDGTPIRARSARSLVRLHWNTAEYVVKHYREPSWRHGLKQLVQRSRAMQTWTISHALADAGISTPRPVACLENRLGPLRRDSYLVYPYVPGATLRTYLERLEPPTSAIDDLRHQLAELWQRLAAVGASLHDAHLANFIVGQGHRLWVIDLDKARLHRSQYLAAARRRRTWTQMSIDFVNTVGRFSKLETQIA